MRNQGNLGTTVYSFDQLIEQQEEHIEFLERQTKQIFSIEGALEKKMYGIGTGELVVVAAPPAMGKRAFALYLISKLSPPTSESAIGIRYFSLEHSAADLFRLILSNHTGYNRSKLAKMMTDPTENERLNTIYTNLKSKHHFVIDEDRFADFLDLALRMKHDQFMHQNKIVIIDYLQLLGQCRNSILETNLCLKQLKLIAEEFQIIIILLSEISRSIETKKDRIPVLTNLLELGQFDQYADKIFMLHRPGYYGFGKTDDELFSPQLMKVFGFNKTNHTNFSVKMHYEWLVNRVVDL